MRNLRLPGCIFLFFLCLAALAPVAAAVVHTYYVAADEVEWNYTPLGLDKMMGMPFMGHAKIYTERGEHRIGTPRRRTPDWHDVSESDLPRIYG